MIEVEKSIKLEKNETIKNLHILSMWEEGKEKVLDLNN